RDWSVTGVQTCALPISPSASKRPVGGRSRSGPVPTKVLNRSSKGDSIVSRCHGSLMSWRVPPTPISVAPTTIRMREENPNAYAAYPRQTPDSTPCWYVSGPRRATPDARHRGPHFRGALGAPRRPRTHGAGKPAPDHPLTPGQAAPDGLHRRYRLSTSTRIGQGLNGSPRHVPMGAGASQCLNHWPDRDWENLVRLCVGPSSVPQRPDCALPPPPPIPPRTAHCEGRWTLWKAADDAGQDRRVDSG